MYTPEFGERLAVLESRVDRHETLLDSFAGNATALAVMAGSMERLTADMKDVASDVKEVKDKQQARAEAEEAGESQSKVAKWTTYGVLGSSLFVTVGSIVVAVLPK